ncbi:MAG: TIM barrel protein [Planctomycetota bacterium]
MIRTAFSTVACPAWKLDEVARTAAELGFDGVELRTFGYGSRQFVCDPMMTGARKVARTFGDLGLDVCCLATSIALHTPIRPHVIGRTFLFDQERETRRATRIVDFASQIEAPFVRLFGFEVPEGETRHAAIRLIAQRLATIADHARHRGVTILLENGGSFRTAAALREVLNAVDSPLAAACYGNAVAHAAGDDFGEGVRTLGRRLRLARLKDVRGGVPVLPGDGDREAEAFVRELAGYPYFDGWLSFEWDAAWHDNLAPADEVLPDAIRRIYGWLGGESSGKAVQAHVTEAAEVA